MIFKKRNFVRKKILILSSIQIFPPKSGGQLRTSNLAKALVKLGHEVEIYSLTGRKEGYLRCDKSEMNHRQSGLSEHVYRGRLFGLLQFLSYRLSIAPFWVIWVAPYLIPRGLQKKMREADHLILDFPYLFNMTKLPFILNTHNAEFELYAEKSIQRRLVKKYELAAFQKAQKILFCDRHDREKFPEIKGILSSKSLIVPNGVDREDYVLDEQVRLNVRARHSMSSDHSVFLFTGSHYAPNLEAFKFLKSFALDHQEVLRRSKIVILVVGSVSPEVQDTESFKVIGRVESIKEYFCASDFGLNPVEEGSGTNVKMIEFLAANLPILSCRFGARGLDLIDKEDVLVFDRQNLLATLLEASLMSAEQRRKMSHNGLVKNEKKVEMKEALVPLFT